MARAPNSVSLEYLVGGRSLDKGRRTGSEAEVFLADLDRQISVLDAKSTQLAVGSEEIVNVVDIKDNERISVGRPIYRIIRAAPAADRRIVVEWENGRVADIDLAERLKHRVFIPVISDDQIFRNIEIEEWGWGIFWPEADEAAIPSRLLFAWADGKSSEFE